ncbi:hypothetical protein [Streptomyces sp. NPDC093261]|uniref:hypothetical protein n=1 Tax=Streptomyces sp. NPDC093261 TaxID=3366037 RepID=UPI003803BDE0
MGRALVHLLLGDGVVLLDQDRVAGRKARKDSKPVTVTGLAAAAGVSTDFIYRHPVLRAQVETLRRARRAAPSAQSNASDIEAASSTLIRRLSPQLTDARRTHHQ